MLSENPQYITQIMSSINNDAYEYMEDRILFRDFFDLRASVTMDESAMRQNIAQKNRFSRYFLGDLQCDETD